jgi:hypothetical protein
MGHYPEVQKNRLVTQSISFVTLGQLFIKLIKVKKAFEYVNRVVE